MVAGIALALFRDRYTPASGVIEDSFVVLYPESDLIRTMAVDAGHLYWTDAPTNTIGEATIDGSAINKTFITGASSPHGVAVDAAAEPDIKAEKVEITQGVQTVNWDAPATAAVPGLGAVAGGAYSGVPLVSDVPTVVRVYASVADGEPQTGVTAELHAYRGSPGALTEIAGSPISTTPRSLAAGPSLPAARTDPTGAYTFTLPAGWTQGGPITLVADINPAVGGARPITECAGCTANNAYALSGIDFTVTGRVTLRPFQVVYRYPNESGHGFTMMRGPDLSSLCDRARDLLPLAPGGLVIDPYPQAVLDIAAEVQRLIHHWRSVNHIDLGEPDLSDCHEIDLCDEDLVALEMAAIDRSIALAHTGHTYLVGFEPVPAGLTWPTQGVTLIGPHSPQRPLTSATHELLHLLGFDHASLACGGGTGGQTGAPWPPDQLGYIQGIGLDRRPGSGGPGPYKIIAPGVGQPQWYDLMSYCASGDADAWLSTVNWTKLVSDDAIGAAPATDRPSVMAAAAAAAGRIAVHASLAAGGHATLLGAASTSSAPTHSHRSAFHIRVLGSHGRVTANVGVVPQRITESSVMMFTATVPATGATSLQLSASGRVLASIRRPNPRPTVRLILPRDGLKASHHTLVIRWRARGARTATLTTAIQYEASPRTGWQTLAAGLTTGSYRIPIAMFAQARRGAHPAHHKRRLLNRHGRNQTHHTSAPLNLWSAPVSAVRPLARADPGSRAGVTVI